MGLKSNKTQATEAQKAQAHEPTPTQLGPMSTLTNQSDRNSHVGSSSWQHKQATFGLPPLMRLHISAREA